LQEDSASTLLGNAHWRGDRSTYLYIVNFDTNTVKASIFVVVLADTNTSTSLWNQTFLSN